MGRLMQVNRPIALALGGRCCEPGLPLLPPPLPSSTPPYPSPGVLAMRSWGPGSPAGEKKLGYRGTMEPDSDSPGYWEQTAWAWISAPPLPVFVKVSTSLLSLSEPQFPQLQNGNDTNIHLIGLLLQFTEVIPSKCLALKKNREWG